MNNPLDIAGSMLNSIISEYEPNDLPGLKDRYHYIQAIFLFAMERYCDICHNEKYFNYIKAWADCHIDKDGNILNQHDLLDDMMPSVLLINLFKKTGEKKYKTALDSTIKRLENWPCNEYGSFYHMYKTPNQVWLDGLFMAGELLAGYAKEYDKPALFDICARQAQNMYDNMRNRESGLYYHAWDCTGQAEWADKDSGLSQEFWARSIGWVAFALCDILEKIPRQHFSYAGIKKQLAELLDAVTEYQDKSSGLWYQIVDKGNRADNWLETSSACLFAYALHKAARLGFVNGEKYADAAALAYNGLINSLKTDSDGRLVVPNICIGTNVTDYNGYVTRPRRNNDSHGTGAFILMCCEFSFLS